MSTPDPLATQAAYGSATEEQVIAALAAFLVAGTTAAGAASIVGQLAGMTPRLAEAAFRAAGVIGLIRSPISAPGLDRQSPASRIKRYTAGQVAHTRAAYLVRAARRMATAARSGPDSVAKAKMAERRYRTNHEAMSRKRVDAGRAVIRVVGRQQPDARGRILLGWYHTGTSTPCPQCAPYVGRNFDALNPPRVGYPGMVHPHDFCRPGPALTLSS